MDREKNFTVKGSSCYFSMVLARKNRLIIEEIVYLAFIYSGFHDCSTGPSLLPARLPQRQNRCLDLVERSVQLSLRLS
jgi:hypothetical protein